MRKIGFVDTEDHCIFKRGSILFFFYVHDMVLAGPDQSALQDVAIQLGKLFDIKVLGELSWFLGIQITRDRDTRSLWINQSAYVEKMAKIYELTIVPGDGKCPLPAGIELHQSPPTSISKPRLREYQQRIGSALYASIISRPDAAKAVNSLAQFLPAPTEYHHSLIER